MKRDVKNPNDVTPLPYQNPPILPYGYCTGSNNAIHLHLHPLAQLTLQTSIGKNFWEVYTNLLRKHRKVVFMGAPCVGKKYLASVLANHIVAEYQKGIAKTNQNFQTNNDVMNWIQVLDASEESEISFTVKLQKRFCR